MPVKRCKHKNLKGKFTTIFGKGVVQLFKLQEIHLPACPVPWHRSPNMLDASNLRWSDTDWYCKSWPPKTVMDRWISEYLPTTVKCSFIIIDLIRITNLAMATGPLVIFGCWLILPASKTIKWHCDCSSKAGSFQVISGDFWITSFLRQKSLISLMIHCLYVQVHFVSLCQGLVARCCKFGKGWERCPVDTWHDVAATLANASNEVHA